MVFQLSLSCPPARLAKLINVLVRNSYRGCAAFLQEFAVLRCWHVLNFSERTKPCRKY